MKDIRKLSNYEEPLIEGEGSREAGEEPEIVLAPAEEAVHRADTQNTEPISKTLEVLRKAEEKNKKDRNGRHVLGEILSLRTADSKSYELTGGIKQRNIILPQNSVGTQRKRRCLRWRKECTGSR